MKNDKENFGQGADPILDDWIRGLMPPEPEFTKDREKVLSDFREGVRREQANRARRTRAGLQKGSLAAVAVLVGVMVFSMNMKGITDGNELMLVKSSPEAGRLLKHEHRNEGFLVLPGVSEEGVNDLDHQIQARTGKLVMIEGHEVFGKTTWGLVYILHAEGDEIAYGFPPLKTPDQVTRAHSVFFTKEWSGFEKKIDLGILQENGIEEITIDDQTYSAKVWFLQTESSGLVKYYRSKITR